jgi:hypothetical protein
LSWQSVLAGVRFILATGLVTTTLSACHKLAKRDLSSILVGSGWSINERMRLTRQQAGTFSFRPAYAAGIRGVRLFLRRWVRLIVLILRIIGLQWLLRADWVDPGRLFKSID